MAESASIEEEVETPGSETRRMLRRVYNKLLLEAGGVTTSMKRLRLFNLTGMNLVVLNKLKLKETVPIELAKIDRSAILAALHKSYLETKTIPTTLAFFDTCQDLIPRHMSLADFRKHLFKMDFVWKKLPNYGFVILERPEVTYGRFVFLKTITSYNVDDIYFVEENGYDESHGGTFYNFLSSLQKDHTKKVIYAISNNEVIYNKSFSAKYTEESFKNWIAGDLLPNLQKPSVVVFNEADHHCQMMPKCSNLTIESLRCEMTDWLEKNDVPYGETMSKAELYTLIEKCTDNNANKYLIDNIISAAGHTPLRLPNHLMSLTPGELTTYFVQMVIDKEKNTDSIDARVSSSIAGIEPHLLKTWFKNIFASYKSLFDRDLQVDQALDGLMVQMNQLGQTSDNDDSDMPSMSEDSD